MLEQLYYYFIEPLKLFIHYNSWWIIWNLFLAFMPAIISFLLFRKKPAYYFLWGILFLTFIVFLPNAPYVLTDIIHLVRDIRSNYYSLPLICFILIPIYFIFMLIGFQCYVISLINMGHFLNIQGWGKFITMTELVLHFLSAIGIYLGRFFRFNTWDLVTQPDIITRSLDDLLGKVPIAFIIVMFIFIIVLYWVMKQVNLALIFYYKSQKFMVN